MKVPVAFVDANVMYSRTLCDWLFMLRLELPGMFRLQSSADVIDEVIYSLRKNHPTADGSLTQAKREHLRRFLDDIVTEFSGDVTFTGDDIHDHHVHGAAIACAAQYLITDDQGFENLNRDDVPYEPHTADTFLCLIAENAPYAVHAVITRQLAYWAGRPNSKPLAQALRDAGCPLFATRVEGALRAMADGRSVHDVLTGVSWEK